MTEAVLKRLPARTAAAALSALLAWTCPLMAGSETPFRSAEGLFDTSRPDTLGLEAAQGTQTITIFHPGEDDGKYNHGAVLIPFGDALYAQWQSSEQDEDSPDTHVLYSVSWNGRDWSAPSRLVGDADYGAHSNGGWWTDGETLVAYIVYWKDAEKKVRSGVTYFIESRDGVNWSNPAPLLDAGGNAIEGVIEQDPHRLPGGRIVTAFHEQPGLVLTPWYTDNPLGIKGWNRGRMSNLPYSGDSSREIEPSWFMRRDGALIMIMRDQDSSFRKLAAVSTDKGVSWTRPVLTNVPDSRSKQSAGNLPDGTAYMAFNPSGNRERFPLALTLSRDGLLFDRAWLLRAGGQDLPPRRHEGQYKRVGYSYPKSVVWGKYLYVVYATNKEDIELTRVPLGSLE